MKQRVSNSRRHSFTTTCAYLLDEPADGHRSKGRDEMLELVCAVGYNDRVSLILSSHLLPKHWCACDHVVVMDKGQVAAQGPIQDLKGRARPGLRVADRYPAAHRRARRQGLWTVHSTDEDVMRVFVPADAGGDRGLAVFTAAPGFDVQVRHLRPSVPTLEDVFAKALGEK